MSSPPVAPFPLTVCWDGRRRATVLNPIALDVPLAVFQITHSESLVRREGAVAGSLLKIHESEILDEFLSSAQTHVFMAAVGDTGTGKSHFIRWLDLEIRHRVAANAERRHIVLIPRSAANLADVMRRILQDFQGDATARLRAEVDRHRGLSEREACQRVLDELAIAIEGMGTAEERPTARGGEDEEEEELLLELLPAFLRDHGIRLELAQRKDGIVKRLASHVLGQRESAEAESLRWTSGDFDLPIIVVKKAGAEAQEIANTLLNDDRLREAAAEVLNRAQRQAITALLRFRRGDLKRALMEIRAQLAEQGRELILLLEDLSITEGLDGELLEALQIRTNDSGERLCTLRSVVGLTREDYQRLRDNIKGRLTRTLWFDVPLGQGSLDSETAALSGFVARYLNAVRLSADEVSAWAQEPAGAEVPSACAECTNRSHCHAAFGAVDNYGLYPLSPIALGRLYRRIVRADNANAPFKPRLLLKTISDVLDEAERGLPRRDFPTQALIESCGLKSTGSELELTLRRELGSDSGRARRAIELYSEQPAIAQPVVVSGIQAALGLQLPAWSLRSVVAVDERETPETGAESSGERAARGTENQQERSAHPAPPIARLEPQVNPYDQWYRGETPSDQAVNNWRQAIYAAVLGAIDWDVEGLAYLRSEFTNSSIKIAGQRTRIADPLLTVNRCAEAAITLRVLKDEAQRRGSGGAALLRTARGQLELWADEVRKNLARRIIDPDGRNGIQIGMQLLCIGVLLRGRGARPNEAILLDQCLRTDWSKETFGDRPPSWNALMRAYAKHAAKIADLLQRAICCTKGGHVGAFLDPSSQLPTLCAMKSGDLPSWPAALVFQSGPFRDIGQLLREVSAHLPTAIEQERAAVADWRRGVSNHLGEDSITDVVPLLGEALDAASGAGNGSNAALQAISALQGRPIKSCIDAVDKALAANDAVSQLATLGNLDRAFMQELQQALEMAAVAIASIEPQLQKKLQEAHGGKSSDEWRHEIQTHLSRIEASLTELIGNEDQDE